MTAHAPLESQHGLTREQRARLRRLVESVGELGGTPQGAMLREYLGFALYDARLGNDNATGDAVARNQGAIAAFLQILEHLNPREKRDDAPQWRSPEEVMAAPDSGY